MNFIYVFYEKLGSNFIGLNSSSLVDGVEYSLLCAKKSAKFGGKVKVNCIFQGKSFPKFFT